MRIKKPKTELNIFHAKRITVKGDYSCVLMESKEF